MKLKKCIWLVLLYNDNDNNNIVSTITQHLYLLSDKNDKQVGQYKYNVTFWCAHVTLVVMKPQNSFPFHLSRTHVSVNNTTYIKNLAMETHQCVLFILYYIYLCQQYETHSDLRVMRPIFTKFGSSPDRAL